MKLTIRLITLVLLFTSGISMAQSIRKPWSELTTQERVAYVNAINSLAKADVQLMASEHGRLFSAGIHGTAQFLPWHRIFLEHLENEIKLQSSDATIPYWDWHEQSWSSTSEIFEDGQGGNTGLFGYDVDGNVWEHPTQNRKFMRSIGSSFFVSSAYQTQTTLSAFSNSIQSNPHNSGHVFVNGDMVTHLSPIDPIFYLHHCMVDKAWADWFNANPTADVSVLDENMVTFNGYPVSTVNAETIVDPRSMKLWYAYDHLLTLNNYDVSGTEVYKYSTGDIVAEDFVTPTLDTCYMVANTDRGIYLKTGFKVTSGGVYHGRLDDFNGSGNKQGIVYHDNGFDSDKQSLSVEAYPNPSTGSFKLQTASILEFENAYTDESIVTTKIVTVYDQAGMELFSKEYEDGDDINLHQYGQGMYIIRLNANGNEYMSKVLIL